MLVSTNSCLNIYLIGTDSCHLYSLFSKC